ncbi:MAG: glycoside hydrolase family 3 C-terminal domain-containing protein [Clostridia bacterium]|nr:glycoside hydrolase family 3 C-terminal domain-containing protein [Clostridia bacterium]
MKNIKLTRQELLSLLADMSIEEKAGQLAQIPISACMEGVTEPTGPMAEMNLTPAQIALSGSVIAVRKIEAEACAQVVREITAMQPHHIPPLVMKDVIHGHQTMFPIPLAIGATFDEGVAEDMGRCGALEGAVSGTHVTFAPMVDVVRDPRWGRVMESPGESPLLCAKMGAAMVRGTRGNDISAPDRLAACAKHFVGYGASQAGQDYAPIDVSRTELYNTYLPPFQACVDAGVDMVMPAFVSIDRIPCVCNEWLLKDVLRGRMGFKGMIISDWDDPHQLMYHGVAADMREVSKLCIGSGLDMDMMSFAHLNHLADLVREGIVDESTLDAACLHVLELKNELGLFHQPVKNDSNACQESVCGNPEIRKAAFEAAVKSCVLLKNDGALPLKKGAKVALVGSHANEHAILGGWTLDADTESTRTLLESFGADERITLVSPEEADVILLATGEKQQDTGEDTSKAHPYLTAAQMEELRRLHTLGKPVVMLLFCGRPLVLTDALPMCDALLNVWFPGSEGADAIRALVMGDENPSGHASMTFPRALGQVPIHHDRLSAARPHVENAIYVNRYIDESHYPLFPFGYGLSYTTFAVDASADGQTVSAKVTNTGAVRGDTVVQVYGRLQHSRLIRPEKQLLAWQRVSLAPGECREISFRITPDMLRMYDAQGAAVEAEGLCDIAVGEDSAVPFSLTVPMN